MCKGIVFESKLALNCEGLLNIDTKRGQAAEQVFLQ